MDTEGLTAGFEPLQDGIYFVFKDDVTSDGFFNHQSSGDIWVGKTTECTNDARVVEVVAVGPDVEEVGPGDVVLVENLQWTKAFSPNGEDRLWRTDITQILAFVDED